MPRNLKKGNDQSELSRLAARLDALVVLLTAILRRGSDDERLKQVAERALERASVALVLGGVPQENVAKLLGIQTKRVNQAVRAYRK